MFVKTVAHRFILYDSTTDLQGNDAPQWDSFIRLSINPYSYNGYTERDLNQVDSLFEPHGTLVEESYFNYNPIKLEWRNIAKFKYFDKEHGDVIEGGTYPQFYELVSMIYTNSEKYYFLDDRGYTTSPDFTDLKHPKQVFIKVRVDTVDIKGFATVPAPYFHAVEVILTPLAIYTKN